MFPEPVARVANVPSVVMELSIPERTAMMVVLFLVTVVTLCVEMNVEMEISKLVSNATRAPKTPMLLILAE